MQTLVHLQRLPVGDAPFGERLERLPCLILSDRLPCASAGGVYGHASMPIDKKAMATGHMAQPTMAILKSAGCKRSASIIGERLRNHCDSDKTPAAGSGIVVFSISFDCG
jgi:hypothetical protein